MGIFDKEEFEDYLLKFKNVLKEVKTFDDHIYEEVLHYIDTSKNKTIAYIGYYDNRDKDYVIHNPFNLGE